MHGTHRLRAAGLTCRPSCPMSSSRGRCLRSVHIAYQMLGEGPFDPSVSAPGIPSLELDEVRGHDRSSLSP